jgi:hypothetical protein
MMLQIWEAIVYTVLGMFTTPMKGICVGIMTTIQDTFSEVVAGKL